jgi:hypothetical protein
VLANRILAGAQAVASYIEDLDDEQWTTTIPGDGRSVGVVVHHIASLYPIEVHMAQMLASGNPITGVTWSVIHETNSKHAKDNAAVSKSEALELLGQNSDAAAAAVGLFSDDELDSAACVSLYGGAPLTAQFFIEDHALRHSFHHLAKIREALSE